MTTYISMLRGINVSGHRKISMAELRQLYVALGHSDVVSYIQSGNVVFRSDGDARMLQGAIEERIGVELGHEVTVVLRTREELAATVQTNPLLAAGRDPAMLHVTFLARSCDPARLKALDVPPHPPDDFRIAGREIFLSCPAGYGNTKLQNGFWERRLGVRATTRNWNTVTKLHELAAHGAE